MVTALLALKEMEPMAEASNAELARALARELDEYIAGGRTLRQVGAIEGALFEAEALRDVLDWFDDLELDAALVCPGQGPEYLSFETFADVARSARQEIAERFGV